MADHMTPRTTPGLIRVVPSMGVLPMHWGAGLAGAAVLLLGLLRLEGRR